jgi:hypothetical protein
MRPGYAVVLDEAFAAWLDSLELRVREEILAYARLLAAHGAALGRPYAAAIDEAGYASMRELRLQIDGAPWRILFALDPDGTAVLLDGGRKGGDMHWYRRHLPEAARRYEHHLTKLRRRSRA